MPQPNHAELLYDPAANILHVSHPQPVNLETAELISEYFRDVMSFWRQTCGGRKAYFLVSWQNVSTNLLESSVYAECVREVADNAALVIVRYLGEPLQRAAGRLVALKLYRPSHIYSSREEALEVIRGLQSGEVSFAAS
jgi:hypothetical protein